MAKDFATAMPFSSHECCSVACCVYVCLLHVYAHSPLQEELAKEQQRSSGLLSGQDALREELAGVGAQLKACQAEVRKDVLCKGLAGMGVQLMACQAELRKDVLCKSLAGLGAQLSACQAEVRRRMEHKRLAAPSCPAAFLSMLSFLVCPSHCSHPGQGLNSILACHKV